MSEDLDQSLSIARPHVRDHVDVAEYVFHCGSFPVPSTVYPQDSDLLSAHGSFCESIHDRSLQEDQRPGGSLLALVDDERR